MPPFAKVILWMLAIWSAVAVPLSLVIAVYSPESLGLSILIALASLLIAILALVPGLVTDLISRSDRSVRAGSSGSESGEGGAGKSVASSFMTGIVIRLVGTVALFVLCRYHMAELTHLIAAMVLGWYVLMTISEVTLLVLLVSPAQHSV